MYRACNNSSRKVLFKMYKKIKTLKILFNLSYLLLYSKINILVINDRMSVWCCVRVIIMIRDGAQQRK